MIVECSFCDRKSRFGQWEIQFYLSKTKSFMDHHLTGVLTKSRMLTEVQPDCKRQVSTQLDYHGYFSPRVAAESSNYSQKVSYMKYHT